MMHVQMNSHKQVHCAHVRDNASSSHYIHIICTVSEPIASATKVTCSLVRMLVYLKATPYETIDDEVLYSSPGFIQQGYVIYT